MENGEWQKAPSDSPHWHWHPRTGPHQLPTYSYSLSLSIPEYTYPYSIHRCPYPYPYLSVPIALPLALSPLLLVTIFLTHQTEKPSKITALSISLASLPHIFLSPFDPLPSCDLIHFDDLRFNPSLDSFVTLRPGPRDEAIFTSALDLLNHPPQSAPCHTHPPLWPPLLTLLTP